MAIYNYFPDRKALLSAALAHAYRDLAANFRPTIDALGDAQNLLDAYRKNCSRRGELMLYLMSRRTEKLPPLELFNECLLNATGRLCKSKREALLLRDMLIDYTHGFAMAAQHFTAAERRQGEADFKQATRRILNTANAS